METSSSPQQSSEKSVVIVNCPIDDFGEYIVSASSVADCVIGIVGMLIYFHQRALSQRAFHHSHHHYNRKNAYCICFRHSNSSGIWEDGTHQERSYEDVSAARLYRAFPLQPLRNERHKICLRQPRSNHHSHNTAVYSFCDMGLVVAYGGLSLIGIAVMSLGDTLSFDANPLGLLLLAGAVFIAVVYTVTLVKILPHYRPITITTYQNLIALFYFLPLMLIFDHDKLSGLSFGLQMWIYLAVLGILCSTVAYACFNYGMRALGATAGSVYNNIIPIFSLLFALALGQESLSWIKVAGMTIVLIGLTIAQRKPKE